MRLSANPLLLADRDGTPLPRITGIETEYGTMYGDEYQTNKLLFANQSLHSQAGYGPDGLDYVDAGPHQEHATKETIDPYQLAHLVLAGHRRTAKNLQATADYLADNWRESWGTRPSDLNLIANTRSSDGSSWGSHLNVLARRNLLSAMFIGPVATHHASRIVWSGAGHVVPTANGSFHYELSEKASEIQQISGKESMSKRPLVNLRDEPHASSMDLRRIHDVSSETVFSAIVIAAEAATESIVLRACELGVSLADLQFYDPVQAIKTISHDPTLKVTVPLADHRRHFTGLDAQEALLTRAMNAASKVDYLTTKEQLIGQVVIQLIQNLRTDPEQCYKQIDWVMKRRIIERAIAARRRQASSNGRTVNEGLVAQAAAIEYHRILPKPGLGMRLVAAGHYDGSPSLVATASGPGLTGTRADARGHIITRLRAANVEYSANWSRLHVQIGDEHRWLTMPDPYEIDPIKVEQLLSWAGA